MKRNLYLTFLLLIALNPYQVLAQLSVTQGAAMNMTPLQLVMTQLVGQGITISNATYNDSPALINSDQIGYFSTTGSATTQLGLTAGILMTSGQASIAIGPNNSTSAGYAVPGGMPMSDLDLNVIANRTTHDKCVLEFDFIPEADTLRFRYVFGSEEFYEYCNSNYNDAFGFFLSGPGITGTFSNNSVDIALMPGSLNYVTINNLCNTPGSNWSNTGGIYFQYDGLTYVFTAWHVVTPCQTYHIKLAIADAFDQYLDSGVFLGKNSFSASGLEVTNSFTVPSLGEHAIEGCSDAIVSFTLPSITLSPYVVYYTIGGTATMGVDYTPIPDSVVIPTGNDSTAIIIHPFMDNIPEGIETVILGVVVPLCSGPTILNDTILIYDNTTLLVSAGNDTTICQGSSITLYSVPSGGQGNYHYLWSTGSTSQNIIVTPSAGVHNYIVTVTDACSAIAFDSITVTVHQPPLVTNSPTLFSYCSGSVINIHLTSDLPGSTFSWTASCNSPDVSGYTSGSGDSISQTLFNTGTMHDTVIYLVHASNIGCTGPDLVLKVIIIPLPNVNFQPDGQTFCSGQTTSINLFSDLPPTTFSWTFTPGSTNVTGASNGSGSAIVQLLTNSGYALDSVIYHVTPVDNGCTGTQKNVKVNIKPLPVITLIHCTDSKTVSNAKPFKLKGGIPLGGTFSGPGVNSGTGIFSPSVAGTGVKTIHYSYMNFYGCSSSATETITVASPSGFFCGNPFTDIRDNKQYPTVQLGTQCWFAANLNYGTNIAASVIQTDNCQAEKYCWQDIPANCTLYGGLYQWDEVMQYNDAPDIQGFCPPAWHIPTETDWTLLFSIYYNNGYAGSPLKFTGYSGFNALLSGIRFENSTWNFNTFATMLWSSDNDGSEKAWAHGMNTFNPSVSYYPSLRSNAFSVRCIKD